MDNTVARFRKPQVNFYVGDVETVSAFYKRFFDFTEIFRTPEQGTAQHVELSLDGFVLGIASIEAAQSVHNIPAGFGPPKAEIALWTNDVDVIFNTLVQNGVAVLSEPHNFLQRLRAAWVYDPAGNPVQIVAKINNPANA